MIAFLRKLAAVLFLLLFALLFNITFCNAAQVDLKLTEEEAAFIKKHPVIRLGIDPKFVPFEFFDKNGEYKGITADYLVLLNEKTGIKFEPVQGYTWPEAYEKALSGDIDALPAISKTSDRERFFLFSEPYYFFKRVIVTRDTEKSIAGIEDLAGLAVAVQRNSSHHSYLMSYNKLNLSLYDDVETALTSVANGTERAFVGNLATSNYLIRSTGLTNLKFVAFEAEKQQAIYFAVRKDWPQLVSILNKAFDSITMEEKMTIHNKWINLDQKPDYGPILRVIAAAIGILVLVTGVSFYWILRLRKEIDKRKQIQAHLETAKKEAEEANRFKSNFMARMSHEIRTPLNAITGMAYLMKKTSLTLTQKMYADRITQAASNMLSIINDILDFSKIEAGKVELEITSFSMDQVVQNVVNIASYKIEEQGIGFKLIKDPHVPNWFVGDSKRLEQILLNLLNNAAKFTSKGEVALEIRLLAKEKDLHHLSFTIKDSGIGMTDEQVAKLFIPFTQGDSSITRRFGGSGLGLSIVKNLVELMNGEIQVFSTPGEGSTFIVRLSLKMDKEREEEYRRDLSAGHFKNIRALVLEKTGANINLIENYLGSFGLACELTSSQNSAVSMLEAADGKFAKPFDLFILDYDTPSEGGFKFVDSLRNNKKIAKQPKFIMLLPMMREDLFDKLTENGVDIGIGKPIIPSVLFNGLLEIFKLKAVAASQPSQAEDGRSELNVPNRCVLVAEDNKTNQLIAKALLQQAGIEAILAGDGKVAVELFERFREKIDLILMDLHMPVMNGYESAQAIRKISPNVPIVAMTADVILGVREKCAESGICHYISKPFDPDQFLKTISEIIESTAAAKEPVKPILDRNAGLQTMGGSKELYREVLGEYWKENRETAAGLGQAVAERRYTDAAQIVHKVKSSSGSIGAKALYDLAIKLQKALDSSDFEEAERLQKEFTGMLQNLLKEIESIGKEANREA